MTQSSNDPINHPAYYESHPSGVEVIEIMGRLGFLLGNVFKYTARAGRKPGSDRLTDLKKAEFYAKRIAGAIALDTLVDGKLDWNRAIRYCQYEPDYWRQQILFQILVVVGDRSRVQAYQLMDMLAIAISDLGEQESDV